MKLTMTKEQLSKFVYFGNAQTYEVLIEDGTNDEHFGWNYAKLTGEEWCDAQAYDGPTWEWVLANIPASGSCAPRRLQQVSDEEAVEMIEKWGFPNAPVVFVMNCAVSKKDETIACKAASFIYAASVLGSDEGNWTVGESEIARCTGLKLEDLKRLRDQIQIDLEAYDGVAEVDQYEEAGGGWSYDITIYTDYLANTYNADEGALD